MMLKIGKFVSLLLAVVFVLSACAPAPVTPTPVDLNQVATAVAATIFAQQTGTALANPSATPTLVPMTDTPGAPTATPFVIASATSFSNGGGGSTTPTYSCDIAGTRPRDWSTFHHGDDFDIKWTIINTGTAIWPAGTDLKYYSGTKFTNAGIVELPRMKPGDEYSVSFDAAAPNERGKFVMTWIVQGVYCYPYVAIEVD